MPSSSRPYQSRLLKFALGQYQQGLERHRRAVRQATTAATWGVQTALYPVYVLFQSGRLVGRQLADQPNPLLPKGRKSQSQSSQLFPLVQPSPLEMPLLSALADVRQWLQAEQRTLLTDATSTDIVPSQATDLQASAQLLAQGIASDVATQKLVIVDRWNTVWDILSAEQATRLRSQIAWLLAHFVPAQRRYFGKHLWRLPLAKPTERSLPLVSAFLRLMGWVQTSPVARATNLFAEAALIELPPMPPELLLAPQVPSEPGENAVYESPESQDSEVASGVMTRPTAAAIAQTAGSVESGNADQRLEDSRSAQNRSQTSSDSVVVMSDYVETSTLSTEYLEHPLEKLLRLIDRALSWVEQQSEQLRDWWQTLLNRF
ncbi:hypothetical protein IQ241_02235 [Romeria aff. gracilis LEGE 07310]|uniref:Uncharacterized protein n=1 Tax=Vasconcelosia minhoensis LEGE 07310 TaxID=915328 RepID=A0A8J7AV69_9CYAN|nr:hypothetical protein [Romeria gracilis]MBE9076122.1 hypothetical protein [Romeria aff. gracilis LEGE 07310]